MLQRAAAGDQVAAADVLPMVYKHLLDAARAALLKERRGHTLTPTALVHEVYLKLFGAETTLAYADRAHFYATAARAMQQVLIDHARARLAQKRGGPGEDQTGLEVRRTSLSDLGDVADLLTFDDPARIVSLHEAVSRLEGESARAAEVVRLRFYAGLSVEQTADIMALSPATVKREWQTARAWLYSQLADE